MLGILHHRYQAQDPRRSFGGVVHVWCGRMLILAGAVCGGLGFELAANWSTGQMMVYVAAVFVIALVYIAVLVYWYWFAQRKEAHRVGMEDEGRQN